MRRKSFLVLESPAARRARQGFQSASVRAIRAREFHAQTCDRSAVYRSAGPRLAQLCCFWRPKSRVLSLAHFSAGVGRRSPEALRGSKRTASQHGGHIFWDENVSRETRVLPRNGKKFRGRCGTAEGGAAGRDPSHPQARIGVPVTPRHSAAETKGARRLRGSKGAAVREHGASGAISGGRDPSAFGGRT